jgi:hypothetical protein
MGELWVDGGLYASWSLNEETGHCDDLGPGTGPTPLYGAKVPDGPGNKTRRITR